MTKAPLLRKNRNNHYEGAALSGLATNNHQIIDDSMMAAIDLGTNNCRLMIAQKNRSQFRIIESFSRIVRLGEGLGSSGFLNQRAMDRAARALYLCAEKIEKRGAAKIRAVATQACRFASNGVEFVERIKQETGLPLTIISAEEEANLAVLGCGNLLYPLPSHIEAHWALVIDVGGGSTEISWVKLSQQPSPSLLTPEKHHDKRIKGNLLAAFSASIPIGVVNLSEAYPEPEPKDQSKWFAAMKAKVSESLNNFEVPIEAYEAIKSNNAFVLGTSGAITSLAGLHLGLPHYDRSKVDGLWMTAEHCNQAINNLLARSKIARESEPCIGKARADLVLAGAAILVAIQERWYCQHLRVADRGLREGLLLSMLTSPKSARRRRR
jgi:exopolyphosphatase/guanosine-5'-triphosphate,3'-diphosphate pyrophosphatase